MQGAVKALRGLGVLESGQGPKPGVPILLMWPLLLRGGAAAESQQRLGPGLFLGCWPGDPRSWGQVPYPCALLLNSTSQSPPRCLPTVQAVPWGNFDLERMRSDRADCGPGQHRHPETCLGCPCHLPAHCTPGSPLQGSGDTDGVSSCFPSSWSSHLHLLFNHQFCPHSSRAWGWAMDEVEVCAALDSGPLSSS